MTHDVFDPNFQEKLIAQVRDCMAMAVSMQHDINQVDFIARKDDHSPVTKADHAVQKKLENFLKIQTPDYAFLGEESSDKNINNPSSFWLCDPIDGTREYVKGGHDYAIILALIENDRPVFGLIAAPASGEIAYQEQPYKVVIRDQYDHLDNIKKQEIKGTRLIVGHGASQDALAFEKRFGQKPEQVIVRPSALKFFDLLRGKADYYIRTGDVSEWDIAAGEALLCAVGGQLFHFDGMTKITYGRLSEGFILNGIYASR